MAKGNISVNSENIFPVIKKWLYSDKDIFIRERVSNACDAITKMKKLVGMGEASIEDEPYYKVELVCDKENKTQTDDRRDCFLRRRVPFCGSHADPGISRTKTERRCL